MVNGKGGSCGQSDSQTVPYACCSHGKLSLPLSSLSRNSARTCFRHHWLIHVNLNEMARMRFAYLLTDEIEGIHIGCSSQQTLIEDNNKDHPRVMQELVIHRENQQNSIHTLKEKAVSWGVSKVFYCLVFTVAGISLCTVVSCASVPDLTCKRDIRKIFLILKQTRDVRETNTPIW